jgi:hypothetical protein
MRTARRRLVHALAEVLVLGLLLGSMLVSAPGASGEQPEPTPTVSATPEEEPEEPPTETPEEAAAMDNAAVAAALGLPVEEVTRGVALIPSVDALHEYLDRAGIPSFYGIYVDWNPTFAVNVLSSAEGQQLVETAVDEVVPEDLAPYVFVRVAENSEASLLKAMDVIIQSTEGLAHVDMDIRTGQVLVGATDADSISTLENQIAKLDLPIPTRDVVVEPPGDGLGGNLNSYGGLLITSNPGFIAYCTSGFSVTNGSGTTGVADAAHCYQANSSIDSPDGDHQLTFQDGHWGDNSDVQWFTTTGATDANKIYDGSGTRDITAKVARGSMTVGDPVCGFGIFGGYHCGTIAGTNFNPTGSCFDSHTYNSTFIRVDATPASGGDSGGPWFHSNKAYGLLKGNTCNQANDPVFTAQNYLNSIGVSVITS